MNGVATRFGCDPKNLVRIQVRGGSATSESPRNCGSPHVQRALIIRWRYRSRLYTHLGCRTHHADRDLASIGYEQLFDHAPTLRRMRRRK